MYQVSNCLIVVAMETCIFAGCNYTSVYILHTCIVTVCYACCAVTLLNVYIIYMCVKLMTD